MAQRASGVDTPVVVAVPAPVEAKDEVSALTSQSLPPMSALLAPSKDALAPFDRRAAQHLAGGVDVQPCKPEGGPTGKGPVTSVFALRLGGPFLGTAIGR